MVRIDYGKVKKQNLNSLGLTEDKLKQFYEDPFIVVVLSDYSFYRIFDNPSNCKIFTLDAIQTVTERTEKDMQLFKESIYKIFKERGLGYIGFNVSVNKETCLNTLSKYFKLAYSVKVPFGYGKGYHHNAFFFLDKNGSNDHYIEKFEKEGLKLKLANGETFK